LVWNGEIKTLHGSALKVYREFYTLDDMSLGDVESNVPNGLEALSSSIHGSETFKFETRNVEENITRTSQPQFQNNH
jgi:hypothetical protein